MTTNSITEYSVNNSRLNTEATSTFLVYEDHFSANDENTSLIANATLDEEPIKKTISTAKAVLKETPTIIADHFTIEKSSLVKNNDLKVKETALQDYLKISKIEARHVEQMKLIRPDSRDFREAERLHDQLLSKLKIAQNKLFSLYEGEEAELTSILEKPVIEKMNTLKEYLRKLKIVARHAEKMKIIDRSDSKKLRDATRKFHDELTSQLLSAKIYLYSLYEGEETELLLVLKSAFKEKI